MANSRFTKKEAELVREDIDTLFNSLTKKKQMEFIGELNDIMLFLSAAKEAAPEED